MEHINTPELPDCKVSFPVMHGVAAEIVTVEMQIQPGIPSLTLPGWPQDMAGQVMETITHALSASGLRPPEH